MSLRSRIIRAAYAHPGVRAHLLPLLGPPAVTQNMLGVPPTVPAQPMPTPVFPQQPAAPVYAQPPYPYPYPPSQPVIVQPPAPAIIMPGMMQAPAQPTAPVAPPQIIPVAVPSPDSSPPPPPPLVADGVDVFVTSRTQQGFLSDLAPELDRMLTTGMSRDQVAEWAKIRVRNAFRSKDGLYLILIRHQSTFESDGQFLLGLERAIDIWRGQGNYANAPGV